MADPQRMALAEKVRVMHDAPITARGSKYRQMVHVTVALKDGTELNATVEAPRGSEHNFASEADVVRKFQLLARKALPQARVDALCDAVLNLQALDDAATLVELMRL